MHELTDDDIIKLVLQGYTKAYTMLVKRYQHMVFTLAMKILKNSEDAEEATQDAFVKVYRSLDKYSGESKFSTWLYAIARNTCLSKRRSIKPEHTIDTEIEAQAIDKASDAIEYKSRRSLLDNAIKGLPTDDAIVISLFYLQEQTIEEISSITDLSISNVKVKLYRARKRLKDILVTNYPKEVAEL